MTPPDLLPAPSAAPIAAFPPPASPDPTLAGEIAAALASLPVAMREALLLVEVCGFSYAEVGQLVGVPEGTVKSRVHRAREGVVRWYAGTEVERR